LVLDPFFIRENPWSAVVLESVRIGVPGLSPVPPPLRLFPALTVYVSSLSLDAAP